MNITDTDIAGSPAYYPHTFDATADRVLLVRMSAADYRLSSFLDSRLLAPGMTAAWFDYDPLAVSARLIMPKPLHMIFHTGHVGSTLLSRLLDEVPGVLGLREPHPLQTLADMADATQSGESYQARLKTFLRLWSRGFAATHTVVLKATSITGRIAPDIFNAAPDIKAVYLEPSGGILYCRESGRDIGPGGPQDFRGSTPRAIARRNWDLRDSLPGRGLGWRSWPPSRR